MKFLLVAALTGAALAQQGAQGTQSTTVGAGAAPSSNLPAAQAGGKGKGGKGTTAIVTQTTQTTTTTTTSQNQNSLPLWATLPMEPGQVWDAELQQWVFPPESPSQQNQREQAFQNQQQQLGFQGEQQWQNQQQLGFQGEQQWQNQQLGFQGEQQWQNQQNQQQLPSPWVPLPQYSSRSPGGLYAGTPATATVGPTVPYQPQQQQQQQPQQQSQQQPQQQPQQQQQQQSSPWVPLPQYSSRSPGGLYAGTPATATVGATVSTTATGVATSSYAGAPITTTSYAGAPATTTSYAGAPITTTSYAGAPITTTSYAGAPATTTSYAGVPRASAALYGGATPGDAVEVSVPVPSLYVSKGKVEVQDTTCANAGVGALWCSAKQKCLRAWEEPCPTFGEDTETRVNVKPEAVTPATVTATLYVPRSIAAQPQTAQSLYPTLTQAATQNLYATRPAPVAPAVTPLAAIRAAPVQLFGTAPAPVGGQRDEQGCALGGGYSFCAALNRCVRPWETPCPATPSTSVTFAPAVAATLPAAPARATVGGQRDAGGCITGAGYSFCQSLNRCVRQWETPCPA